MSKERSTRPADEPAPTTRRGFLRKIWLGLGGLAALQVLWVGFDIIRPRKRRPSATTAESIFVAGPLERFEPDSVTAFPEGKFYLVRLADGGFLALSRTCTHLGCTVPWVAQDHNFACPCHASVFDITGEVLGPPAPRALDLFPVRVENQIVKVDLSQAIRRQHFDPDQVTRA